MTTASAMRAMVLHRPGESLRLECRAVPQPGPGEVRIAVSACGVCRTDLHLLDGELPDPRLPVIPGHEVVGRVGALGAGVTTLRLGQRVGVPWLGWTCGRCAFCRAGQENLCEAARFTGYTRDGGYAEQIIADARYAFPLPGGLADAEAAPLLCAGLIGYRAWRMAGPARRIGLYGFGAAAHICIQVARHAGQEVFAFLRPGDTAGADFARALGASWAGASDTAPPAPLDAAIIFAPVGALVPAALAAIRPGGRVICAGIHMSDIPAFPYALLWRERGIQSVANLTRRDGEEFLALAPQIPVRTHVTVFPLHQANMALDQLRAGGLNGAAVLLTET